MDILSIFGERLEELMFDKKSTSDLLAKSVGIDASVIRRYVRKETIPTLGNAIKLANYFSCSLDFLFGLSDSTENIKFKNALSFAESFKRILNERGYSRYLLCKETHIADQRADDWFHGTRTPTMESAIILAKFFDCSLDYLVGRE